MFSFMSGGLSSKVKSSSGVRVKRSKEYFAAKDYYSISSSIKLELDLLSTCSASPLVNQTYYYNGTSSLFPVVNDTIYTSRRARNPNTFIAGNYKMTRNGSQFVALTVDNKGKVTHRANCR